MDIESKKFWNTSVELVSTVQKTISYINFVMRSAPQHKVEALQSGSRPLNLLHEEREEERGKLMLEERRNKKKRASNVFNNCAVDFNIRTNRFFVAQFLATPAR